MSANKTTSTKGTRNTDPQSKRTELCGKQRQAKEDARRSRVRRAIVERLEDAYPHYPGDKPISLPPESWQRVGQKPVSSRRQCRSTDLSESDFEKVKQSMSAVMSKAIADADLAGEHLTRLTDHLLEIDCSVNTDIEQYFQARKRTLASLYFAAAEPHPSPDTLKRLALRYALDARRPVEGDLRRFEILRVTQGWRVIEYRSIAERGLPFRLPGRILKDIYTILILDHVLARRPQIFELMELIENLLGGVPKETDCLLPRCGVGNAEKYTKIQVDISKNTVWVGEEVLPVSSAEAYFVDAVVKGNGNWVSIKNFVSEEHRLMIGTRPDRAYKKLPTLVRNRIESAGGKGYRLRPNRSDPA